VVIFESISATDNCTDTPEITCQPPSGTAFPVGNHIVTCTATDPSGNSSACTFTIQVVPTTLVATSTADSGPGTLRQALLDANASPGTNVIQFNFTGPAPYTIHLLTPLPELNDMVSLEGESQPGFVFDPIIEVDGTNAVPDGTGDPSNPLSTGLILSQDSNIIQGIILSGFDVGIRIRSANNLIGGTGPGQGNVLTGNSGAGIVLESTSATGNVIQGNDIGLSPNQPSQGNGGDGILLTDGASQNVIGGPEPGMGNTIAFNDGNGVALDPSAGTGNAIRGNAIFSNGGLGIDLGSDGVSPNDESDADEGPNRGQNTTSDLSAFTDNGFTTIKGSLQSVAEQAYRVDLFLNQNADASGVAEGQSFIGTTNLVTDAQGKGSFAITLPTDANATQFITSSVTDADNNTSEFSAPSQVGSLPVILVHPVGTNLPPSAAFTFCVEAGGTAPLAYQWRRNGANIPDATNACYTINNVELTDGGTYTVIVANRFGAVTSDPAVLKLLLPELAAGDDFEDRVSISGFTGIASGTNFVATRQEGEPLHFGKPGGKSVWYSWIPSETGIASFKTTGSTFDTLLAIYTGNSLTNLQVEGKDEDRGGFFTSGIRFNAFKDTPYHIVVDGFGGATGDFVFTWEFEPTDVLLPIILTEPVNQTVAEGSSASFTVEAVGICVDGHHNCRHNDKDHHNDKHDDDEVSMLEYQWLLNGEVVPGATNATLTIPEVNRGDLGNYSVVVMERERSQESQPANLQINTTGNAVQIVQFQDKFLDALLSPNPLRLGGIIETPPSDASGGSTVVRGFTGTQVFNTDRSSTESGEEPICGVVGGASEWITIIPEETGLLNLSTFGSSYNTVVAVFRRSVTNAPFLDLIDCNVNASSNVFYSEVNIPVEAGQTNIIVIDGLCTDEPCTLQLNASLIIPASFSFVQRLADGSSEMQVVGRPDMSLTIEATSDFKEWSPLMTTNAPSGIFNFVDPLSSGIPQRYYRAVLLP
jgi:hypothetical protein